MFSVLKYLILNFVQEDVLFRTLIFKSDIFEQLESKVFLMFLTKENDVLKFAEVKNEIFYSYLILHKKYHYFITHFKSPCESPFFM